MRGGAEANMFCFIGCPVAVVMITSFVLIGLSVSICDKVSRIFNPRKTIA